MPLLRIDLYEGRSEQELRKLLDTVHEVTVEAFGVPARDRYQIVHEHGASQMIVEDTGLDIPRSENFVLIQMTTRPRSRAQKERFYALLVARLEERCGIPPSDVMVNLVGCTDEDWSFGYGRAQFLTGEL